MTKILQFTNARVTFILASEMAVGVMVATVAVIANLVLSGASKLNLNRPLVYMGDSLQFANLVRAAQNGNVFHYENLGAPFGQDWLTTAYGAEWLQASFVALLDLGASEPWKAINTYLLLSVFLVSWSAYFASRTLGISRQASILISLAMGLLRSIFAWASWPPLQNYAGIMLLSAISIRIASGANLDSLIRFLPASVTAKSRKRVALFAIGASVGISAIGANYYMWFSLILITFLTILFFIRAHTREIAKELLVPLFAQVSALVAILAPILISRLSIGKPINEVSTGDRRAFAALANGGELPSVFMSASGSFSDSFFRLVAPLRAFLDEYQSSSFITDSRPRGGIAIILAVVLIACGSIIIRKKKAILTHSQEFISDLNKVLVVSVILILMYVRGALGLLVAFFIPSLRGFDRIIPLITFCALLAIGLFASQKLFKGLKLAALLFLMLSVLDYSSGVKPFDQEKIINSQNSVEKLRDGSDYLSPTEAEVRSIVEAAESNFESGCSVLVLPVNTYPVDFPAGIVSYLTYDAIKPGLIKSKIHWSSGSVPDTRNSSINEEYRELFLSKNYSRLLEFAESRYTCGVLVFGGLQEAMSRATDGAFDSFQNLRAQIIGLGYEECSPINRSQMRLYCPSAKR